jgi:hypothetical protein
MRVLKKRPTVFTMAHRKSVMMENLHTVLDWDTEPSPLMYGIFSKAVDGRYI